MKMYRITIKSGKELIHIKTTGSTKQAAINKVCMYEGCPESAVIEIREINFKGVTYV